MLLADAPHVTDIEWVALPTQFVTFGGESRTPHFFIGVEKRTAALVTLDDGRERVVGLLCAYDFSNCSRDELEEWRDGAVPRAGPW